MQQILYLIQKEFRQIFRDRAMVFILFFAPLVQLTVLGFAITVDVNNIKTLIVDHDRSTISRELGRKFEHNPSFRVIGYTESHAEVRQLIDNWKAQVAVVIPPGLARDLQRGRTPEMLLIVDGLDGNTAGIALGYARGLLTDFAAELIAASPVPAGLNRRFSIVEPEIRMWYNLNLESRNYMVPGLVAVLLTMISMFLSSMGLVREKEIGTLEQLMVTPIKTWQLVLGKILPFLFLAFIELGLMLVVAFLVFELTAAGSITLLYVLATMYLFSTLGLGIFISTLAQSQQQAMFISWFFMIFLIFMSGFLFPIENMPVIVQKLTYLNPMRFFVIILREIFLKGSNLWHLRFESVSLVVFGLAIFVLSFLKFQKRVS